MSRLQPGEVFAGYVIERQLGAGGMGEVYLARHPRLPRRDAVKVLSQELAGDPSFRARFEREAQAAAGLSHPHIVTVHDRGEDDGRLWIAFEYIDGQDLAELVRDRALPPREIARLIGEVAGALDAAGSRGLIHRDVKPANILIDRSGHALLADFGIARGVSDAAQLTVTGTMLGTLAYASPEQLRDLPIDSRSDQYSLACTAFALLTGAPPYSGTSPTATILAHVQDPIPAASIRNPHLPAGVDRVFARALAKASDDRFPSSRAFAAALASALDDAPDGPSPMPSALTEAAYAETVRGPVARTRPRLPLIVGVLAAIAVLVAGITVFAMRGASSATDAGVNSAVMAASEDTFCAGYGDSGRLACTAMPGTRGAVPGAMVDTGLEGVTDVAVATSARCAVSRAKLYCWGDSPLAGGATPNDSNGLRDVSAVAMGQEDVCAISAGEVYCWGRLSYPETRTVAMPEKVPGLSGATAIAVDGLAGAMGTSSVATGTYCAIVRGAAWCWGYGYQGSAGVRSEGSVVKEPAKVIDLGTVTAIDTIGTVSCAISDGDVFCWGDRSRFAAISSAELDQKPTMKDQVMSPVPARMDGFGKVDKLSLGTSWTDVGGILRTPEPVLCAVANGALKCRGDNAHGQLGQGTTTRTYEAVEVLPSGVADAVVGADFACAETGGEPLCWGEFPGRARGDLDAARVPMPR